MIYSWHAQDANGHLFLYFSDTIFHIQGQECVGWSVDNLNGQISSLPVVRLTYNDAKKTWSGYREPEQAEVTPFPAPEEDYTQGTGVYPLITGKHSHCQF